MTGLQIVRMTTTTTAGNIILTHTHSLSSTKPEADSQPLKAEFTENYSIQAQVFSLCKFSLSVLSIVACEFESCCWSERSSKNTVNAKSESTSKPLD